MSMIPRFLSYPLRKPIRTVLGAGMAIGSYQGYQVLQEYEEKKQKVEKVFSPFIDWLEEKGWKEPSLPPSSRYEIFLRNFTSRIEPMIGSRDFTEEPGPGPNFFPAVLELGKLLIPHIPRAAKKLDKIILDFLEKMKKQ